MLICRAPPKTSMKDATVSAILSFETWVELFYLPLWIIIMTFKLKALVLPVVLHLVCDTSFTRRGKSFTFHDGCKSLNWSRNRNMSRAISSPWIIQIQLRPSLDICVASVLRHKFKFHDVNVLLQFQGVLALTSPATRVAKQKIESNSRFCAETVGSRFGQMVIKFRSAKFLPGIAFTICTNQYHLLKNGAAKAIEAI